MKLYEIPDFKNKRVRKNDWMEHCYVVFDGDDWVDEDGTIANSIVAKYFHANYWEIYEECKESETESTSTFKSTFCPNCSAEISIVIKKKED